MKTDKNKFQSIMTSAGYDASKYNNRQRMTRSINHVLSNTGIELKICANGFAWQYEKNGVKTQYTLSLRLNLTNGQAMIRKAKPRYMEDYCVLKEIGLFLQNDFVKNEIHSNVHTPEPCQRCEGLGHIPAFHYFCNGICFECYGLGISSRSARLIVEDVETKSNHLTNL